MNNHTPALTAEQWKKTTITKKIFRVKDLRKYIKWCEKENGIECNQIRFACGQIENIRQSISSLGSAELKQEITVSMRTAQRVTEHGVVRGFTNVRSWFSKTRAGLMLGKVEVPNNRSIFAFVVSCEDGSQKECFTLAELFEPCVCERNIISEQQIVGLLDDTFRRFEDWCSEKQTLIDELEKFDKEVSKINCGVQGSVKFFNVF